MYCKRNGQISKIDGYYITLLMSHNSLIYTVPCPIENGSLLPLLIFYRQELICILSLLCVINSSIEIVII